MSHIEDFLVNATTPQAPHRRGDITSAWDCYTAGGRSAKLYRTGDRTSRRRFSYFAADLPAATDEGQYTEVLEELVDSQWQVFRVSPLWNVAWDQEKERRDQDLETSGRTASTNILRMLDMNVERQYDERGLKRYARVITGYVATHAVSGQDNPYTVEMETLKGLKGTRTDADAIKISVYTSMMGEVKKIFLGILCGIEAAELQLKSNDVVNLPVFLTQGNKDTKERVIFGLEKCFDCVISPLYLPDEELRWMSAMWAGESEDSSQKEAEPEEEDAENSERLINKSKKGGKKTSAKKQPEELKLTFVVPRKDEETEKAKIRHFTCAFPTDQIHQVWRHVHSGNDTEFSDNEMEKFHDILRNVVYDNTKIDTDSLELYQITLPFLKAVRSGIIRIDKSNHVKVVLRYLTELCQGNMFQSDPTLAASVQDNCTMEWA